MKKLLFLFLVLPTLLLAQENEENTKNEEEINQTFSFNPQLYFYVNHHINSGDNFLAEGHEVDFIGGGFQINLIKFNNIKFGLGWDFANYDVTNPVSIGNINNTLYIAAYGKFQYQWDIMKNLSLEPFLGIGATKIQQRYSNSFRDSFYGMNLYAGLNIAFKFTSNFSVFTGFNYNNIRFNVKTTERWKDYFNKVNQTQVQFGIIFSFDGDKSL